MNLGTLVDLQTAIWPVSLGLVSLVVGTYFVRVRRSTVFDTARKAEAKELGIDRPMGQFPYIDPFLCAGCATCVSACPEGDVLGMVGGTAVVINGLRCIGIGACEEACPVEAIKVGVGDLSSRKDVPLLDDLLQTSLPGVFVAGELGGLSLVSNAVRQGRKAIESIVARSEGAGPAAPVLDLAIVGAGPAGLSAGLTASAKGLSYVILEKEKGLGGTVLNYPRRKMVLTQPVELPPWGKLSRRKYQKEDLLAEFERLVEEAGLDVRFDSPVKGVDRSNGHYVIAAGGQSYEARNVLLALGRRGDPRKLGVPGEELSKVMYRLIDAAAYKGEKILVVGGGDSAIEAALQLGRDGANQVSISYRKEKFFRIKQKNQIAVDAAIKKGDVTPLFSSQVKEVTPGSVKLEVDGETIEIENDYVFVSIGGVPPFGLLRDIGIRFGGEEAEPVAQTPTVN